MKIRDIESLCRVALRCSGLDAGWIECYAFAMKHIDLDREDLEDAIVLWVDEERQRRWAKVREYLR